jgi:hypothetical protein
MSNVLARWLVPSTRWNPVGHATPQEAKAISHRRHRARRPAVTSWLGPFQVGAAVSVLRLLVWPSAVVLVIVLLMWAVPGLIDSSERLALHRAPVHRDSTAIQTSVAVALKTQIIFVYRDINGTVHRVLANESDADKFVNDTLIYLDAECSAIKVELQRQIASLLETAFSDRQEAINRFADWYFAWGQSWRLLGVAIVRGANGARINDVQGILEGSRNEVEAYLVQNYQSLVLKPELRTPSIDAGISRILADDG